MAFDASKANRVKRFIECLKHTKGEFHGKPFTLLPWQEKIISDVFGTVRDDDPTMRSIRRLTLKSQRSRASRNLALPSRSICW